MIIFTTALLFLLHCSVISCQKLSAKYNDYANKGDRVYFDINQKLVLTCTNTDDAGTAISWKKDGQPVAEAFRELSHHYDVQNNGATSTFKIAHTRPDDDGNYLCETETESQSFTAIARAVARMKPSDASVVEGEKLVLRCNALGTDLEVAWSYPNTTASGRVRFENYEVVNGNPIENGTLIIDHVKMSDRGEYKCMVQNGDDDDSEVIANAFVRVKDKYAALWPFIFICIEVFVLCSVILIYEKKRNRAEVDDSETDIASETKNGKK